MLTLGCILISISSLYFFGFPLARLLVPPENDRESAWILAPFLGLAVITLFLQNLVYLNIPLRSSVPWLWACGLISWIWLSREKRLFSVFRGFPLFLFIAAIGVYLIQGLGLLVAGAEVYVGRAWHDQFNYTAIAQFLTDYPFHLSIQDVQNQPYLYSAIIKKLDRIGPSIFQGFLATSSFTAAKVVFEPAILLSPFMTVLALYGLGRKLFLSSPWALLAAIAGGLLPSVALIHLESFFSQAFVIPYLLLWPFTIQESLLRPSWRNITMNSLVLAAATTFYTEFYLIFLAIALFEVLHEVFRLGLKHLSLALPLIIVVGIALLLNLGFISGLINITQRVAWSDTLAGIYPWAFKTEGLQRLWLGDLVSKFHPLLTQFFGPITLFLVFIACWGLGKWAWERKEGTSLAIFVLAVGPLFLRLLGSQYKYQFYKILLSVSPLMPLGLILAWRKGMLPLKTKMPNLGLIGLIILLPLAFWGTIDMAYRSGAGKTLEEIGRGGAHRLIDPGTVKIQKFLSKVKDEIILIVWKDDFFNGGYVNGWLAYMARNNRVWVSNPLISDINLQSLPEARWFPDPPPGKFLLLTSALLGGRLSGSSVQLECSASPYFLWKVAGRNWAAIKDIHNPNGLEESRGEYFFWVGNGDSVLETISGREGVLILEGEIFPGPSIPSQDLRNIQITTDAGYLEKIQIKAWGLSQFFLPIGNGRTIIKIRCLDQPTVAALPSGDTRPLLLQIRNLKVLGFKGENR